MKTTLIALALGGFASFALVGQALAFDCSVARKPPAAGSAAIVDPDTGEVIEFLKSHPGDDEHIHGGFIEFAVGEDAVSTFVHAPDGELPPVREGGPQHGCDGKGLDTIGVCLGFEE